MCVCAALCESEVSFACITVYFLTQSEILMCVVGRGVEKGVDRSSEQLIK